MCNATTSRGSKTIRGVVYEICGGCGKPIRGTGKSMGGMSIWVVKDFVRNGKRVPFSDQWLALCESQGFQLVCRHRAMLVIEHGEQHGLFGGSERMKTERKSFFRRLAERKGSPAIDHEDVICLVRA